MRRESLILILDVSGVRKSVKEILIHSNLVYTNILLF